MMVTEIKKYNIISKKSEAIVDIANYIKRIIILKEKFMLF